jgi:hypothetical protein
VDDLLQESVQGGHGEVVYELAADPAVVKFLGAYRGRSKARLSVLRWFWQSMQSVERFKGLSLSDLVEFQENSVTKGDRFLILDALQKAIRSREGTDGSLRGYYSVVVTFFRKNRVLLPPDDFVFQASREPNRGKMSLDVVRMLVKSADLEFKAVYLTMWMGILDCERFFYFNSKYGEALVEHLRKKGVNEPFMVEFPGRKQTLNRYPFHTFIGHDALVAWQEYFERVRGYPGKGEPIVLGRDGPMKKGGVWSKHKRILRKLNYVKGSGALHNRYGYGLHEFRDVARTLLHLEGKKEGLDLEAVEHWMGHDVDPNHYDKFHMDTQYLLEQYRIAEKYLNIVSGASSPQHQNIDELIEQIIRNKPACDKLLDALTEKVGAKLAPIEDMQNR